jgi:hypothetical protein
MRLRRWMRRRGRSGGGRYWLRVRCWTRVWKRWCDLPKCVDPDVSDAEFACHGYGVAEGLRDGFHVNPLLISSFGRISVVDIAERRIFPILPIRHIHRHFILSSITNIKHTLRQLRTIYHALMLLIALLNPLHRTLHSLFVRSINTNIPSSYNTSQRVIICISSASVHATIGKVLKLTINTQPHSRNNPHNTPPLHIMRHNQKPTNLIRSFSYIHLPIRPLLSSNETCLIVLGRVERNLELSSVLRNDFAYRARCCCGFEGLESLVEGKSERFILLLRFVGIFVSLYD